MRFILRKCPRCGGYTLMDMCKRCGVQTHIPHPPRFSPEDKYILYKIPQGGNADSKMS